MMERRLLFGMAGVVLAVLFAFLAQAIVDSRACNGGVCAPAIPAASGHGRS